MQKERAKAKEAERPERADLAVYTHRILAVLRSLNAIDCDAVLHAALELNRASHTRWSQTVSPEEPS